ncbi:DUF1656 domain-containing protein [Sphingomonas naphthae]|uniref:DUF1656 domain-containing protein n=1 Tax=Sphingomonas naphthae TaxID=1813468 RepID=A0ABY7TJP5_9SPHN|nr:DUF1656 domain-containing protein [Sphingomonas naphthae]WCT73001.1 DUF1656 domain-containing protein [Sphingomonas naphthae]
MIGEVSIGGVFVPTLLLLGIAAALLTAVVVRLFAAFGLYRFVAYRALVDLCLFVLILGLLAFLLPLFGITP